MLVIVVLGCKEILSKLPWRRVSLLEIGDTNTDGLWRGGISPLNYGKFGYLAQPLLVTIPRSSLRFPASYQCELTESSLKSERIDSN